LATPAQLPSLYPINPFGSLFSPSSLSRTMHRMILEVKEVRGFAGYKPGTD